MLITLLYSTLYSKNFCNFFHFSLYEIFPARAPINNSTAYIDLTSFKPDIAPGLNRSAGEQAAYQAVGLILSIAFGVVGGLITGECMIYKD